MRFPLVRVEVAPIPVPRQPSASSLSWPAEEQSVLRPPVRTQARAAAERALALLVVPSLRFVPQVLARVQKVSEPQVQPQAPLRAQAMPRAKALLPALAQLPASAQLTRSSMPTVGCYELSGARLENPRRLPTHPTRRRPQR